MYTTCTRTREIRKLTGQLETHALLSDSSTTTHVLKHVNTICGVLGQSVKIPQVWLIYLSLGSRRIQMNYVYIFLTVDLVPDVHRIQPLATPRHARLVPSRTQESLDTQQDGR